MQTPIGSAIDPNSSKEYSSVEAHKPLIVLLPNMASSGPANDTVENAWSYPQVFDRGGDLRKPIGEIRPVAGEQARALTLTPGAYAEIVVLDLVNPIGPGRQLLARTG
jgi:hypothetical protein